MTSQPHIKSSGINISSFISLLNKLYLVEEKIEEWSTDMSPGKKERLSFLLENLQLQNSPLEKIHPIRYQLLHRSVSALLEAIKINATNALMLVHSFSKDDFGYSDYTQFLSLYGVECPLNAIVSLPLSGKIKLYVGWVKENLFCLK